MLKHYVALQSFLAQLRDEEGATAVEYGLMVALIAAVIIAVVTTLGQGVHDKFNSVATSI